MDQFLSAETVIIDLLLVVTIVAIAVRRFMMPYQHIFGVSCLSDPQPTDTPGNESST